jgi:hypothetical protein
MIKKSCLDNVRASMIYNSTSTTCYRDSFTYFYVQVEWSVVEA